MPNAEGIAGTEAQFLPAPTVPVVPLAASGLTNPASVRHPKNEENKPQINGRPLTIAVMTAASDRHLSVFNEALRHHRAGKLDQADALYRKILASSPNHSPTICNLAATLAGRGRWEEAESCYRRALELQPDDADVLSNLGNLLLARGRPSEAEDCYRKGLALAPDRVALHVNLGNLYFQQDRLQQAQDAFVAALAIDPGLALARSNLGVTLWRRGQPTEARACFEEILVADPDNFDALANIGNMLDAEGKHREAVECFRRVVAKRPDWASGYFNLAVAAGHCQDRDAAIAAFRRAIDLKPDHVAALRGLAQQLADSQRLTEAKGILEHAIALAPDDGHCAFELGNVLHGMGDFEAAAGQYRRAIALHPAVAEYFNNLGSTLQSLGRTKEAQTALQTALSLKPDFANALNNLGNVHATLGDNEQAVDAYRRAYELDTTMLVAANNLASALRTLQRYDESDQLIDEILRKDPQNYAACNNRGLLLQAQNRHADAIAWYESAVKMAPSYPEALNNLAICYQTLGQFDRAVQIYRDAIATNPNTAPSYFNLGNLLPMMGRDDEAVVVLRKALQIDPGYRHVYPYLLHAMQQQANWTNLDSLIATMCQGVEDDLAAGRPIKASCFGLQSTPSSLAFRYRVAREISHQIEESIRGIKSRLDLTYPVAKTAQSKLRVGFVSPDFRFHSAGLAFKEVIERINRGRFELFGYSLSPLPPDDFTASYRKTFDGFRDISGASFQEAAEVINLDQVHILVDLAGHTRFSRMEIFALRPAPVQVHYLGYSATLGSDFIRYLLTDPQQISPGAERWFSEKLVYLPDSFMATTRSEFGPPVTRGEAGLPDQGIVFANFNGHYKLEPKVFGIWMRLLKRIPNSVLWLLSGSPSSNANLRREAVARGVDPARLVFAPKLPHPFHLARLRLADLSLDTLFLGGGVTSVDALWAGVPVVTVAGEAPPARNGLSLLHAIGLDELAVDSIEAYEKLAFQLATDPAQLSQIKVRLWANRETHPLFDVARLTRHLESAFEAIWRHHVDGFWDHIRIPALPTEGTK